jgi:hypothetical protein
MAGEHRATREESQMSTITTSAPTMGWPRAAIVTIAVLVVALVTAVTLAATVAGRTTTRTVFRSVPAADQIYSCRLGRPC